MLGRQLSRWNPLVPLLGVQCPPWGFWNCPSFPSGVGSCERPPSRSSQAFPVSEPDFFHDGWNKTGFEEWFFGQRKTQTTLPKHRCMKNVRGDILGPSLRINFHVKKKTLILSFLNLSCPHLDIAQIALPTDSTHHHNQCNRCQTYSQHHSTICRCRYKHW